MARLCTNPVFLKHPIGLVGYFTSSAGVFHLVESLASQIPEEKHVAFLTAAWAHSASYLAGLIGGIVLFTVSNTMNTSVVERTVEIGTLRAIGLRRSGILRLFVTEGALLGVCGALLGIVLALIASAAVNQMNIPWIPPSTVEPVPLTILVWGETRMIVGTTLGLICIAVLSAWWPAHRAARLNVVEALRHA